MSEKAQTTIVGVLLLALVNIVGSGLVIYKTLQLRTAMDTTHQAFLHAQERGQQAGKSNFVVSVNTHYIDFIRESNKTVFEGNLALGGILLADGVAFFLVHRFLKGMETKEVVN